MPPGRPVRTWQGRGSAPWAPGKTSASRRRSTGTEKHQELDDERVLVFDLRNRRGKTSGMEVGHIGAKGAGLFHVRGGRVTRLVIYGERKHAVTDLGLAREADAADSP
jgi:hypothetical protein